MSAAGDAPPGPSARKEHNTNILIALIGALGTIGAAAIPIIHSMTAPSETPAPAATSAAARSGGDIEIEAVNLADRSARLVTLLPYESNASDSHAAVQEAIFRSPKDATHWLKLTVTQSDHNKKVTFTGKDYDGKEDVAELDADHAGDGDKATVDTKKFKLQAEVVEARTGADPDTVAPRSGKVFEKLVLKVTCEDHS